MRLRRSDDRGHVGSASTLGYTNGRVHQTGGGVVLVSVGRLTRLYLVAPAWMKDVAVSVVGVRNNRMRRGEHFRERYQTLMSNTTVSEEDLKAVQRTELLELLREVYEFSPYYRRVLQEAVGLPEEWIGRDPLEVVATLPLLEKSDLRESLRDIVSTDPRRKTATITYTSGTTGTPMAVEVDSESLQETFAEWERYYRWLGLPNRFRSVRLSGRILVKPDATEPPFWVTNHASRQLFMSTYHLSPRNLPAYIEKLNQFQPQLIDGYPSAIYVLAKFINDTQSKIDFLPTAISTTAETLFDYQREEIERAFSCGVYNQYASSEGAPWIVQCSEGGYHLWTDTGVFEFLNTREAEDGRIVADLVVTSFRSRKTPLIRYNIGDTVSLLPSSASCSCGSAFPVIEGVTGREEDLLYTPERGYVGRLDTAYKGLHGIFRSKIVQTKDDHIDVYVVPTADYSADVAEHLRDNLLDRLGNIGIDVFTVESIPLSSNGKFKAVERRVPSV